MTSNATADAAAIEEPPQYSTNRNTVKARRRKNNMQGAFKVEDAARTADYKAMIHTRKRVMEKDEWQNATELMKKAMLEQAMTEAMATRYV